MPTPSEKKGFNDSGLINLIPSYEEIEAYAAERGSAVNIDKFYDHYCAVGWRIGQTPIRDWRAAFRKWEQTEKPAFSAPRAQSSPQDKGKKSSKEKRSAFFPDEPEDLNVIDASFSTDDFFEAALRRSYGDDYEVYCSEEK